MSSWLRVLLFGFVAAFGVLAAFLFVKGELKAAVGACSPVALAAPLLLEAWRPGKYVLRKPADGSPDNLFTRLRQFRIDHPGVDGALISWGLTALALTLVGALLLRLIRAFSSW